MADPIRIANCSGFFGDRLSAAREMVERGPIHVLTGDWLAELAVDRHRLPAIRSLNLVIHGLLEEGVAASTRQDPQAKSLGEWLRARVVDLPEALLP